MTPPSKTIGVREQQDYTEQIAVSLILRNSSDHIAIIFASKGQYYKLPGGGIEGSEGHIPAAEREALEETGCKVSVDKKCVATTEEWRFDLHQISYCYEARVVEDTGKLELTEEEVEEGLKHEWSDIGEALGKLRAAQPNSEFGRYIQERDVFFLEQIAK
jgi:8-oxo-dGTP pyrophosphatase MutT (NUDIX family)